MAAPAIAAIAVAELWVYPVKACKGIRLQTAALTPTGVAYDRSWMVVRADTGKFLTQRQLPKMCQIAVSLPPEALLGAEWGKLQPGAALTLAAPSMPAPLQVPLTQPGGGAVTTRRVNVWEWSGAAADEGDEAAEWLSTYLERPVRLMRHIGGSAAATPGDGEEAPTVRMADPEFAAGHEVKFADGFPLLVARQENLADLNNRLASAEGGGAELPMNRFRPNIILAGGGVDAWADDAWGSVGIAAASAAANSNNNDAGAQLAYVKPCSRCKVTTINQETAEEGREPLKTLGTFRSGKVLGWSEQRRSWTHDVFFGWNAAVTRPGHIRVGDVLTVLQEK